MFGNQVWKEEKMNNVQLLGFLGCDVECKYLPSGVCTSSFRLATNEKWTNKNGEKQERTEWHRIVVWGRLAEVCAKYLSKGRKVRVEGSLRTRSWTDKNNVKRYVTEISARKVDFIDSCSKSAASVSKKPDVDRRRTEKEESNSGFESDVVTENLTAVQSTPRCCEAASVNEDSIAEALEEGVF